MVGSTPCSLSFLAVTEITAGLDIPVAGIETRFTMICLI